MKKFLFLILVCFTPKMFSQNVFPETKKHEVLTIEASTASTSEENTVYNTAGLDEKPEFPGGIQEFDKFIQQNFKVPSEKPNLKGKIYTTFIIEKDGSLSDIKILRDLGYETGNEAIRVLKASPKWKPGKKDNKLVRVLFSSPIIIK